jgi:hypothetical protein
MLVRALTVPRESSESTQGRMELGSELADVLMVG